MMVDRLKQVFAMAEQLPAEEQEVLAELLFVRRLAYDADRRTSRQRG